MYREKGIEAPAVTDHPASRFEQSGHILQKGILQQPFGSAGGTEGIYENQVEVPVHLFHRIAGIRKNNQGEFVLLKTKIEFCRITDRVIDFYDRLVQFRETDAVEKLVRFLLRARYGAPYGAWAPTADKASCDVCS